MALLNTDPLMAFAPTTPTRVGSVVLLERDINIQEAGRAILSRIGYNVLQACCLAELAEVLQGSRPEFLVLSASLLAEAGSGIENLKHSPNWPCSCRVIILATPGHPESVSLGSFGSNATKASTIEELPTILSRFAKMRPEGN